MKTYKLCFGDKISPFRKTDIENVLKSKIGMYSQEDADITYIISSYGDIPTIETQTRIYDQKCITNNILFKEHLWNQFLFHIKKTKHTSILGSSYLYYDIALDFSNKLGCYNKIHENTDNLIIVGNDIDEITLQDIRENYLNINIELVLLHSNILVDFIKYFDIMHIITIDRSQFIKYNNINYIDTTDIITDKIISDFYSI